MQSQLKQDELFVRVRKEFSVLDLDGDGFIDKHEMLTWLAERNVDQEHREQIVEELFNKCDQDKNGGVDLNEFTEQYIDTKNQLENKQAQLKEELKLLDADRQKN